MPVSSICAKASRGAAAAASMLDATPRTAAPFRKSRLPSFTMSSIAFSPLVSCTCSIAGAARGDRPQRLDASCPDRDIPVVQIDGRIAVAGDQHHLVAEAQSLGFRAY